MSYYLQNDTWYVSYMPDGRYGKKVRVKLPPGTTEEDAERINEYYKQSIKQKKYNSRKIVGQTFHDLSEHYLMYIQLHRQPRTYDDVACSLRHLERIIGNVNVTQLNGSHVNIYKEIRSKEVKNRTVNKELSWLSGFLTWCRRNTDHDIPNLDIERLPYNKPPIIILSASEVMAILDKAQGMHKAFFSLLYFMGLRLNEASKLKWQDIDFENDQIVIHGKGGKYRIEPMPEVIREQLWTILSTIPDRIGYIFVTNRGNPLYWARGILNNIVKKAGIQKKVTPHLLRHSFATHLMAEGVNLKIISKLLGHSTIGITADTYTHVSIEHMRQAQKLIDKL